MIKALGSRINLHACDNILAVSFFACVEDLIENESVLKLSEYKQHMNVTRYQHSVNVSYYSFIICKKLKLNYIAAARGGLLHDLFFYSWQDEGFHRNYKSKSKAVRRHLVEHPVTAFENAREIAELTDIEKDIILKHMWPTTKVLPQFKETFVVSLVDKASALCEFCDHVGRLAIKAMETHISRYKI